MVACAPATLSDGKTKVVINNELLLAVASAAALETLLPEDELVVPKALVTEEQINKLVAERVPAWATAERSQSTGVFQGVATNGVRVNVRSLPSEAQRGHLRIAVAGGRAEELAGKMGAVALGARTLQEGGAFAPW
jgi:hypothetical protein